jgi:hypothetical protein
MATKKVASITLAELTDRYTKHMEDAGKSRGTVFSYESELRLAQRELGADLSIGAITRDAIETFNNSPRVTLLKSGRPKSQLSIDKTRRVLRLALKWAADTKLIDVSPAERIEEPAPTTEKRTKKSKNEPLPHTPDVTVVVGDEQITDGSPAPKKPRKRKQAIVLEVSQPDAERAADEAEAMIAATNPEPAA